MRLVLHREIPDDRSLRRQWNDLALQMTRPEVFYTYEWALAVDRAYRALMPPLLFLAYDEDALVGVATLATDNSAKGAFFLAHSTADYCDFISAPERRAEFLGEVFAELRRLNIANVQFANLPAESATAQAVKKIATRHGYSVFSRPAYQCAQVDFSSPERREALLRTIRSNSKLARGIKGMNKIAPVALRHLETWEQIDSAMPRFVEAHVARFLTTGRMSNLARPERRVFLGELARLLSENGWLALSQLQVGELAVAWNYGFQFAGTRFWYQPTFDSGWEKYSPGFCLLWKMVEDGCEDPGTHLVDLGLGAEGYKENIATGEYPTVYVSVSRSSVVNLKTMTRYYGAKAVKSVPHLESSVRRVLRSFSSMRTASSGKQGLSIAGQLLSRSCRALFDKREVLFFESAPSGFAMEPRMPGALSLQPITPETLAEFAMHTDDPDLLAYLVRAAGRFRAKSVQGFALVNAHDAPLHLCWVTDFENFQMSELHCKLSAPSPQSVMIFDCFTPAPVRGHGYYALAVSRLALQQRALGKSPWIFSSASNLSSIRGIEKAGFVRRFSLRRSRVLFRATTVRSRALSAAESPVEASAT